MNSQQIYSLLQPIPSFLGVFAANELTHHIPQPTQPWSLVVNTEPNTRQGEHWIALLYDGNSQRGIDCFCSYGTHPYFLPHSIQKVLFHSTIIHYATYRLQQLCSTLCGQYCVYFIFSRTILHQSFTTFMQQFHRHRPEKNDTLIARLINPFIHFSQQDLKWMTDTTQACIRDFY